MPIELLLINAQRTRSSRRVAGINATLVHDGGIVARSTALVLRGSHLPKPRWSRERYQAWAVPSPDSVIQPPSFVHGDGGITYHQHALEHRMTHGGFGEAGPGTSWMSLLMPLIDGEATSGLCALLAARRLWIRNQRGLRKRRRCRSHQRRREHRPRSATVGSVDSRRIRDHRGARNRTRTRCNRTRRPPWTRGSSHPKPPRHHLLTVER